MGYKVLDGRNLAIPDGRLLIVFFDPRNPDSDSAHRVFKSFPGLLSELEAEIARITKPDDFPESMEYIMVEDPITHTKAIFIPDTGDRSLFGEELNRINLKIFYAIGQAYRLYRKVAIILPTEKRRANLFKNFDTNCQTFFDTGWDLVVYVYDMNDYNDLNFVPEYHNLD